MYWPGECCRTDLQPLPEGSGSFVHRRLEVKVTGHCVFVELYCVRWFGVLISQVVGQRGSMYFIRVQSAAVRLSLLLMSEYSDLPPYSVVQD